MLNDQKRKEHKRHDGDYKQREGTTDQMEMLSTKTSSQGGR